MLPYTNDQILEEKKICEEINRMKYSIFSAKLQQFNEKNVDCVTSAELAPKAPDGRTFKFENRKVLTGS